MMELLPLQSRNHGISHSSSNRPQLAHDIFLNLTDGLKSLPFSKVILVLGKTRSCMAPNVEYRGAESPGWFDVLPKNSASDMMYKWAYCHDEAANHQLPIAAAFWIMGIIFAQECSSLTQNLMQIHCSTHSVILNVTTTQYTCSLSAICHPRWLVQWCRHCSHMCSPVLSPWLPGYVDVAQTIFSFNNGGAFSRQTSYVWNHHILHL